MEVVGFSAPIVAVRGTAYTIPCDRPESDGTLQWNSTTLVVAEVEAAGQTGLGYTYTDASVVHLIGGKLADVVCRRDAMDPPGAFQAMQRQVRNIGREGLAATAISAVDLALWDLKAKLLGLPLAVLLGCRRDAVPIYGSGGFTSYDDAELRDQLGGWARQDGCRWVKMKVGREPARDPARVAAAKSAIGSCALMVDANGAYAAKQAIALAETFAHEAQVEWLEEPVSADDLAGLRFVRRRVPGSIEIAAGEYGYSPDYFRRMLAAGAVDVLQADITRCGGLTAFMQVGALCEARHIDLSAHCGPAAHLHAACSVPRVRHLEWFHDHVRVESMLFDGAPVPRDGMIRPDLSRPGIGLTLREADAARYLV